uniref:serine hydrolase n=1 Tax=Klebsiella pneumoniae TaxID=573 RepID=UPI0015EFDA90|nr:serine hydrolase [Klebsiella pneumoniae]
MNDMEHFHNNNSVTSSSVTTEELNTARRLITRRINEHRLSVGISLALSAYSDTHFICHGNSDPLASKPTTPDTVYEIGSVSKVLTGLFALLVVPGRTGITRYTGAGCSAGRIDIPGHGTGYRHTF